MKVIQLRGTNATGKTTTVRQFINRGNFEVKSIFVGSRDIEYHWDEERKIAIIGRYDQRVSGGVDGYITNKDFLRDTIIRMLRLIKPEVLIFEGVMYGVTFEFAFNLIRALKALHCEYIGLCFMPPLDTVFDRLAKRNGGKEVDYMSVQNKWFTASRAYEKLRKNGINVKAINTAKVPEDSMYKILEDEI